MLHDTLSALLSGKVVCIHAGNLYALTARADHTPAVEKIYHAKQRPLHKSLGIFISNMAMAHHYTIVPNAHLKLIYTLLKNHVTIILKAKSHSILSFYCLKQGTIAIRIPRNKNLIQIIDRIGIPLINTSANLANKKGACMLYQAKLAFSQHSMYWTPSNLNDSNALASPIIRIAGNTLEKIR